MKKYEDEVRAYLKERGWDNLRPGDLAKSVSIEAGELLELFQWDNPELAEVKKDTERMKKIAGELADVLIYSIDMSVLLGLDTGKIILEKLEKVKKKYPAKLMKDSGKEQPGTDAAYMQIKTNHRKAGLE